MELEEIHESMKKKDREETMKTLLCLHDSTIRTECSACSGPLKESDEHLGQIYICEDCGGIQGTTYMGESLQIVKEEWVDFDPHPWELQYFDLTVLDGKGGKASRNGWLHKLTRKLVQMG